MIRDHDGVTHVVSLPGELDFCGSSALQAYLSGIRRPYAAPAASPTSPAWPTSTALASACLSGAGTAGNRLASSALAGPHGAVRRLLAVNGLLTWFDVHDTVQEAVSRTGPAESAARRPGFGCVFVGQPVGLRRNAPYRSGGHMVAKKTGTGVKNKALYKRLRNLGVSAKESARVANASVKTPSKKASPRGGGRLLR